MILRRKFQSRFSEVTREWEWGTVVLMGGGPSLTHEQARTVYYAHRAGKVFCIAINNSYLISPYADACYFADSKWWEQHKKMHEFKEFAGQKCSIQDSMTKIFDDSVHILKNRDFPKHGWGLSMQQDSIVTGRHGGFQALNIAILAGAAKVILLGFDGKVADDGATHWHNGHEVATNPAAYGEYLKSFSEAVDQIQAARVRVINCSANSAIDTFEKMSLEDALC